MKTFGCFVGKSFLLGLASIALLSGCSLLPSFHPRLPGNRAFIAYWPPAENSNQLRLAVKDNIDMKGVVTTAGSKRLARKSAPAEKDAPCLAIARRAQCPDRGQSEPERICGRSLRLQRIFRNARQVRSAARASCSREVRVAVRRWPWRVEWLTWLSGRTQPARSACPPLGAASLG